MRVTNVGQENNSGTLSVLKAGTVGALGGAVLRSVAPLTTEEDAIFFNQSAKEAIKQKVKKVRTNEIEKIGHEFKSGALKVNTEAFDTFEKTKDVIAEEPKKALDYIKDSADAVKAGFTSLVKRVDTAGVAKEHIEVNNIKSAAKANRPLAFFVITGALVTMTGQLLINAFKSALPEEEEVKKQPEVHELTMADILLEGLGTNTEVLFLTNEAGRQNKD